MANFGLNNNLIAEAALDLGDRLGRRLDDDPTWIACPPDMHARHLADLFLGRQGFQSCLAPDCDYIGGQDQPSPRGVSLYNSLPGKWDPVTAVRRGKADIAQDRLQDPSGGL